MRPSSRTPEGSTVGQRLFLLVLLPLTVLTVALGVVANDRWDKRQAGAEVVARVEDMRALVALQSALYGERAAVEIDLRSASFGVPATLGAALLGVSEPDDTFAATNDALSAARTAPTDLSEMLEEARILGTAGNALAIPAYERVDDAIVEQFIVELEVMHEIGLRTADADLTGQLLQLEATVLAFSAATDQSTGLANTWFGDESDNAQSLATLGFQTARYDIAIASVDPALLAEDVRENLTTKDALISSTVVELLSGSIEQPEQGDMGELPFIIGVFEAAYTRSADLNDLVGATADDVELTASRIATDGSDAFLVALAIGGAAILFSVLSSLRLSRSIAAPMASVAERTRELQAGQIVAAPLGLAGPRELQDVASAINDVSVNLASLEGKLDALSRADLDDPYLEEALPGRLGETLMNSVDTLSSSIADRRNLQARLGHQANHDALTGLANRAAALEHLSQRLTTASQAPVGLLFVDLDDFRRANDVFGHATGDEVLVEVGHRLRTTSRPSDLVARLGGDEFLIIAEEADSVETLEHIAHRILGRATAPMPLASAGELSIAASVGIAWTDDAAVNALALLAHADAALYVAKSSDQRIAVFDDRLRSKIGRRSTIEQQLRSALSADQLEVHYQPVLSSESLDVTQLEALVRWMGEDSYGPDDFIPVAEQSDLVIDIDRFVLTTATKDLVAMHADTGKAQLRVAVNISGRHLLHADVAAHVGEALATSGLDPSKLIIEVTETALIADLDRAAEHLSALRAMGVRVSVDDFGTGFTSITQLRHLPIDELKIDRSLVAELPGDQALVRVVRDLAEHFGMTTVAEGVESQEQADFLRELGCTNLQGWLYARAMPTVELGRWFGARNEITAMNRAGAPDLP